MTLDAWVSLQRRGMRLASYNKKTGIEPVEMHIFDNKWLAAFPHL